MPELPEVEAIARTARGAVGASVERVEVIRGSYLKDQQGDLLGRSIVDVRRRGKLVLFMLDDGRIMQCHNAMSGYWDFADEPWTFDYVEGQRTATERDVRVALSLSNGRLLRFHDARLFGRLKITESIPELGPEPLGTELLLEGSPVIGKREFLKNLRYSLKPIKPLLMDQRFLAGIGNIYSNEACHASGIDPRWPACSIPEDQAGILFDALGCVLSLSIPQVRYDWLAIYRRKKCGTCGGPVTREELAGRSTFSCERCQWEPI